MKQWVRSALIVFFALVMLLSGGYLVYYFVSSGQNQRQYDDLSSLKTEVTTPRPALPEDGADETIPQPDMMWVTDPDTGDVIQVLPEFAQLYVKNTDLVGWIQIPGTVIDYPVMQTPTKTDYYLKRDFEKNKSKWGCIYVRENCDVEKPSDNLTIYGHHMRDGSMFAGLDAYLKKDFWQENPYIYFDTLTQLHTYQIIAVFKTTATAEGFSYHLFADAQDAAEFDAYVAKCKELAFYDTGISAEYGDKLITLSTCEYTQNDGRLVVVAKRIA